MNPFAQPTFQIRGHAQRLSDGGASNKPVVPPAGPSTTSPPTTTPTNPPTSCPALPGTPSPHPDTAKLTTLAAEFQALSLAKAAVDKELEGLRAQLAKGVEASPDLARLREEARAEVMKELGVGLSRDGGFLEGSSELSRDNVRFLGTFLKRQTPQSVINAHITHSPLTWNPATESINTLSPISLVSLCSFAGAPTDLQRVLEYLEQHFPNEPPTLTPSSYRIPLAITRIRSILNHPSPLQFLKYNPLEATAFIRNNLVRMEQDYAAYSAAVAMWAVVGEMRVLAALTGVERPALEWTPGGGFKGATGGYKVFRDARRFMGWRKGVHRVEEKGTELARMDRFVQLLQANPTVPPPSRSTPLLSLLVLTLSPPPPLPTFLFHLAVLTTTTPHLSLARARVLSALAYLLPNGVTADDARVLLKEGAEEPGEDGWLGVVVDKAVELWGEAMGALRGGGMEVVFGEETLDDGM